MAALPRTIQVAGSNNISEDYPGNGSNDFPKGSGSMKSLPKTIQVGECNVFHQGPNKSMADFLRTSQVVNYYGIPDDTKWENDGFAQDYPAKGAQELSCER